MSPIYASTNPKTKKALKEQVAAHAAGTGPAVRAFQPGGLFPGTTNGTDTIEGPHYPQPHRWYARVQITDGIITKVLG